VAVWLKALCHGRTIIVRVLDGHYRCPVCRELHKAVW
jgi:hypothetical protein